MERPVATQAMTDAELVKQCQAGQWQAYNELVARHQDRLFNLIYRCLGHWEDARDLCQEVFLKAFRALPEFRGEATFGTWLHRIGVNALISWRRIKRPKPALSLSGEDDVSGERLLEPASTATDPAQQADQQERERFIQQAINTLDEVQRILVILRDVEGYDYEEIAHMLGCPRGTVKSRLHRARLLLREKLRPLILEEQRK